MAKNRASGDSQLATGSTTKLTPPRPETAPRSTTSFPTRAKAVAFGLAAALAFGGCGGAGTNPASTGNGGAPSGGVGSGGAASTTGPIPGSGGSPTPGAATGGDSGSSTASGGSGAAMQTPGTGTGGAGGPAGPSGGRGGARAGAAGGTSGVAPGATGGAAGSAVVDPGTGTGSPSTPVDWSAAVPGGPAASGAATAATVTVNRGTTIGRVGAGFAGLSLEKTHVANGSLTGSNAPLIALFRLLGPSVIRFGGDDVDKETWNPAALPGGGSAPFPTAVGTADVDELADFLTATGWKTIYGLNYKTGTAAGAAAEAKYVAGKLGAHLYGFEIGNEINFSGAWTAIRPRWESFATAVMAAAPNVPLIGPAAAGSGLMTVTVPFAADEASKLVLLTQHYYRAQARTGGATIASLMNVDATLVSWLKTVSGAATLNHIKDGFRLGECNTFSQHGQDGISNALASALWASDFLFTNAINGASGVNLHGGQLGMDASLPTLPFYYAPIQESNGAVTEAAPLFYGMLLFSLAGTGNVLQTTASAAGVNLSAYTIAGADGSSSIILNNKDAAQTVTATVDVGAAVARAGVVYLQGPAPVSLAATTGVTLAGSPIPPTGLWAPKPPFALAVTGTTVKVVVPPASTALIHAQP